MDKKEYENALPEVCVKNSHNFRITGKDDTKELVCINCGKTERQLELMKEV